MDWNRVVDRISPYIVKIETPDGSGTGFLCVYNEDKKYCGIATALHVVRNAEDWQQPIRIHNHAFNDSVFLRESDRVIFTDWKADSAVIFFPTGNLVMPEEIINL